MYTPCLAVSFYGGAAESAASFAALDALVSCGFRLSRVSASGMSAAGAILFLSGAGGSLPGELSLLPSYIISVCTSRSLSSLSVPLTAVLTDAQTGTAAIFGERALGELRTDSALFIPDAPLDGIIRACSCPWTAARPLDTPFGALCGVPSAAGIRYIFSGALREGEDAALRIIFASTHPGSVCAGDMAARVALLLGEDMRLLAGDAPGYEIVLHPDPDAPAHELFADIRSAVAAEAERIALYCLNGKNVV